MFRTPCSFIAHLLFLVATLTSNVLAVNASMRTSFYAAADSLETTPPGIGADNLSSNHSEASNTEFPIDMTEEKSGPTDSEQPDAFEEWVRPLTTLFGPPFTQSSRRSHFTHQSLESISPISEDRPPELFIA